MTNRFLQLSLACLVASTFASAGAQAKGPRLETTDTMIPSGDAGIQLFVRNKHPAGKETSTDKILLFVHGATYPAETAFDLPIEGVSMMDLIAARGYDVYLVDVRGYGRSTRPVEMSQPPAANKPIVSTKVAAHDLGAAVDYILRKRKVAKINVMGWSWGTSIAGLYTSEHNDKVNRLVLYAPQWIRNEPPAQLVDLSRRPFFDLDLAGGIEDQRLFRFRFFVHRAAPRCGFLYFFLELGGGGGGGGGSAGSPARSRRYFTTFLLCSASVALKKWPPCVLATK